MLRATAGKCDRRRRLAGRRAAGAHQAEDGRRLLQTHVVSMLAHVVAVVAERVVELPTDGVPG